MSKLHPLIRGFVVSLNFLHCCIILLHQAPSHALITRILSSEIGYHCDESGHDATIPDSLHGTRLKLRNHSCALPLIDCRPAIRTGTAHLELYSHTSHFCHCSSSGAACRAPTAAP